MDVSGIHEWMNAQASVDFSGKQRIEYFDGTTRRVIDEPPLPCYYVKKEGIEYGYDYTGGVDKSIDYINFRWEPVVRVNYANTIMREKEWWHVNSRGIKTYEKSIPYIYSVMGDFNIRQMVPVKKLYIDIENRSVGGVGDPRKAEGRIFCIAIVDQDGKEWWICENDEKEMFNQYVDIVNQYHLGTGWNFMKYDLPYISNRFKKIYIKSTGRGMELPFMQIQYVDVLAYWRKLSQTVGLSKEVKKAQSGGLDDVAKAVLGQGKFAKVTGSEINEWFEHDRGKLKDYNMQDARLVKELDGKNGYPLSEHYITLATNFGVMIKDSDKNNTMHTQLAMKICRKRNPPLVLPEPPHKKVTYTGAYCGEVPQPMVYENVGVGDLKSTYPNVIKTFMLSPEVRQLFLRWKDSGMDMKEFVRQVVVGA